MKNSVLFGLLKRFPIFAILPLVPFAHESVAATATPKYIQANSVAPTTAQTALTVRYSAAQTAGNLNVVIVGWHDSSAHLNSVKDSIGNTYQLAIGPTVRTGSGPVTQVVLYAKNIFAATANANAITLTFDRAASYPEVRILEYNGISTSAPLDVAVASSGLSASSSSGTVKTTNATDLLLGANTVWTNTTGPGSGFTKRLQTSDGDITEDRLVTAVGSFSASASLSSSAGWVMQMVAFRAGSSASTSSSIPSSIALAWNAAPATSNPATNPTGYQLHFGVSSGNYTQSINVGNTTKASVPNLTRGTTYYFAVTAYNAAGVQSPSSNQISVTAP